jgi:hypothetical protein
MAIPVLNTTNYYYSGQANSFTYDFPSGSSNTLLVVVVTGQGFSSIPATRGVTYGGVAMTQTGMGWPSSTIFTEMWYLLAPATGSNTLAINYSNGSNGGMNIAIYALSNVSQSLPINELQIKYIPTYHFTGGTGYGWDIITMANSYPELIIDACVFGQSSSSGFGTAYTGQTAVGSGSSYKYVSSLSDATMRWDETFYYTPFCSHQAIGITELKTISVNDTVNLGDNSSVTKGLLIAVADGIKLSESFSWVKNIFISVSDTLQLQDRGWFGAVNLFNNIRKNVSTWLNTDKH